MRKKQIFLCFKKPCAKKNSNHTQSSNNHFYRYSLKDFMYLVVDVTWL